MVTMAGKVETFHSISKLPSDTLWKKLSEKRKLELQVCKSTQRKIEQKRKARTLIGRARQLASVYEVEPVDKLLLPVPVRI